MGRYIASLPKIGYLEAKGKADQILKEVPGTIELPNAPEEWFPNLVCVVENPTFDAAAYADTEQEMRRFRDYPNDPRPRRWLVVPNAAELAE